MSNTTLPRAIAHPADDRLPGGMTDDLDPGAGIAGDAGTVERDAATAAQAKADAQAKAEAPKLALSATAVAAGAMTATTSAMIGSHLGALGTLAGAAAGSVIGALLSATYSFGLQRAHHALSGLHPPRIASSLRGSATRRASATAMTAPVDINGAPPAPGDTSTSATRSDASVGEPRPGDGAGATLLARRPGPRGMKVIAGVLATAALAFGATLLVITGFEKVTGGSLAGVQGATTIQHTTRSADQGTDQDATVGSTEPIQPAEVAPTPEAPTATPTPTPNTTPSATPTPSAETPAPQASTTPSPSATPASQQAG